MSYLSQPTTASDNPYRLSPHEVPRGPSTSARALLLIGSTVRVAYGMGGLFAPAKMVSAQYAPDTHHLDDPRLLLRAFSGHQLLVGCLTLLTVKHSPRLARPAAILSLLIDASDVISALLELPIRGRSDKTITGGIVISGAGVITFAAALRALSR
jgi:hypothetical protein